MQQCMHCWKCTSWFKSWFTCLLYKIKKTPTQHLVFRDHLHPPTSRLFKFEGPCLSLCTPSFWTLWCNHVWLGIKSQSSSLSRFLIAAAIFLGHLSCYSNADDSRLWSWLWCWGCLWKWGTENIAFVRCTGTVSASPQIVTPTPEATPREMPVGDEAERVSEAPGCLYFQLHCEKQDHAVLTGSSVIKNTVRLPPLSVPP